MYGVHVKSESVPGGGDINSPGAKADAGKPRVGLVTGGFPRALLAVSDLATKGAAKYTENGWREVDNGFKRYTDALGRHLLKEGIEKYDSDPKMAGVLHATQVAWNALARLELLLMEEDHAE